MWACSLGLLCLTLLFHTCSREDFQENFVILLVLKVLPPAGLLSSGTSMTPLVFLSSGPGVFRLGSGLGLWNSWKIPRNVSVCSDFVSVCSSVVFPSPFLSQLTPEWFYSFHGGFCRGFWCPLGFLLLVGLSEGSLEFSAGIPSSPQLERECLNLEQKNCVTFVLWLVSNEMLIVLALFGLIQQRNGSTELFLTVCLTSFGLFDSDMVGKTCKTLPEVKTLVWILCVHLGYSCLK